MTPADVQALKEKWRQRERFYLARAENSLERNYDPGGFVNNAKAAAIKQCADELEPVIQALEALRDEMRAWWSPDDQPCKRYVQHPKTVGDECGQCGYSEHVHDMRKWADRLDLLLHGAARSRR